MSDMESEVKLKILDLLCSMMESEHSKFEPEVEDDLPDVESLLGEPDAEVKVTKVGVAKPKDEESGVMDAVLSSIAGDEPEEDEEEKPKRFPHMKRKSFSV
jgi:hypothetical protein